MVSSFAIQIRRIGCLTVCLFVGIQVSLAQFTAILNVPPDSPGWSAESGTQVNLFDGGSLVGPFGFWAQPGSEVNVFGGAIGENFTSSGVVNILGGTVGDGFAVTGDGVVNVSGGSFGNGPRISGSLSIKGAEFWLDGAPVNGLDVVGNQRVFDLGELELRGTFADGTPFAFSSKNGDTFRENLGDGTFSNVSLTLETTDLPPVGPQLIVTSINPLPLGIRRGQTLRVDDTGIVPRNFVAGMGSVVNVEPGGEIRENFNAIGSEVTISGGTIGFDFNAFNDSVIHMSSGFAGGRGNAFDTSVIN